MSASLLSVEDLCIDYLTETGDVRIVDHLSFDIKPGEILGLAGESGSGKTTTLKGILRLLGHPAAITGGSVLFKDMDILDMDEDQLRDFRWKEISLVMQSAMNALNPVLTVAAQIRDVIVAHEGATASDARIAELLELVGIEASRANSYPHELSGGMRQRVVIAMALALRPPLVFMDEPTTALDVVVQKGILDKITALKEEIGFSILLITHDLALMLDFCTRIGILYGGRLAESAPSDVLRTQPRHPYTQGLMRAFPDVHADPSDLVGIAGTPPNPRDPPSGCRFHPRCPHAQARCRADQPPMRELAPDHHVACWQYA